MSIENDELTHALSCTGIDEDRADEALHGLALRVRAGWIARASGRERLHLGCINHRASGRFDSNDWLRMAVKKQTERVVRMAAPLPPIRVGARARTAGTHYDFWLTLFLRGVAVAWIAEGVLQWLAVLNDDSGTLLAYASPLRIAALFFFCVLDFVAAIGLWLVTTWGAAVWIATIVGHGLVAALAPDFLPEPVAVLASDLLLLAAYMALALLASREDRRR